MTTTKKPFQYVLDIDKADELCPENCNVVSMRGYSRFTDFYLFVPKEGLFFRTANIRRYGAYRSEMFMDGEFIGGIKNKKISKIQELYNAKEYEDASSYALGHKLYKETKLGGHKINVYKEAARISHQLCDESGAKGHAIRKEIRHHILNGGEW